MCADETKPRSRRNRSKSPEVVATNKRRVDYHNLRNPFPPIDVFSADAVASIHETALKTLEELGMKVLLPAAIDFFRQSGAPPES